MITKKTSTGNNESLVKAINKNSDGTYTVVSFSRSKTFKTLRGATACAKKWGLI